MMRSDTYCVLALKKTNRDYLFSPLCPSKSSELCVGKELQASKAAERGSFLFSNAVSAAHNDMQSSFRRFLQSSLHAGICNKRNRKVLWGAVDWSI